MSALENPKHERFAQEIAKEKKLEAAHRAGYAGKRQSAHALLQRSDISLRVEEILAGREKIETKAAEGTIERARITKADVLAMLIEDRNLPREKCHTAA